MSDPIKELSAHLSALYTDPDPSQKAKANDWLQNFQKTVSHRSQLVHHLLARLSYHTHLFAFHLEEPDLE